MESVPAVVKTEAKEDRVGSVKTIYQVSGWTIFWRNFLAGFGRALGGIFIYLVFISLAAFVFITTVWPQISPIFGSYVKLMNSLTTGGQPTTNSNNNLKLPFLDSIKK